MDHNKFFTVELDESSEGTLRVMPTKYLDGLNPHKAIAEMQAYIETLENALEQHQNGPAVTPMTVHSIGALAFELELVRTFLNSFKQAYGTMH
ncbi:MAG: hypothetical protein JRI36_02790 [Deltaproteobacteria bacterium]|nr:hypothetical protein [Deltaproteobacteria bacterium]